jgi:hypothetical protein
MTTITKYRIYCITDSQWEYAWRETPPTVCPVDNTHTVNNQSISGFETMSPNTMTINEEYPGYSTGKNFRAESYTMICPTGTSIHQYTWARPISVCEIKFISNVEHNGDIINNKVGGGSPVGILTTSVETGANILPVSQTVIDNTLIGFLIEIKNGGDSQEIGELIVKNAIDNELTTEFTASQSYPTGSYIYMKAQTIKNYKIVNVGVNGIGIYRKSSSYLPANVPSSVYYTNNGAETKEITFYIEYLY